ncbi:MAG TPA: hypothetical protein VJB96_02735 [Patescibacteria group bacterium]|nr:hypothetical protein [Patescibacteria group bacterium]
MASQLAQGIVNPVLPGALGSGGSNAGPPAVGAIISSLIGGFLILSFIATLVYMLLGGFDWATSGGDKTKLQSARDKITNALVGLVVVGASWAVMMIVGNFIGIEFPNLPIPTIGD